MEDRGGRRSRHVFALLVITRLVIARLVILSEAKDLAPVRRWLPPSTLLPPPAETAVLSRLLSLIAVGLCFHAADARAQLSVCNETEVEVFVALAAPSDSTESDNTGGGGWTSRGWFVFGPHACGDLVGELRFRYYYLYAENTRFRASLRFGDREIWDFSDDRPLLAGDFPFCVGPDDAFEIADQSACEAQGYARVGFREIDVGEHAQVVLTLNAAP
jgi:uncharacterized membrane protein